MIYFNNIPNQYLSAAVLIPWLESLAYFYRVKINNLHYNFVNESVLLKMNQNYLNHDTHTDIITFSYVAIPSVEAEIFISIDRMRENATLHSESIENEMLRLLSHGFLHCVGYNDVTEEEKLIMKEEEERCINMFHVKQEKNV